MIGAGRVGTAVAVGLRRAGHRLVGVSGGARTEERAGRYLPGVSVVDAHVAAASAELVVVSTPDDAIRSTVEALAAAAALRPGTWVVHLSGALGLDTLDAALRVGARRLAIHPLQTFPDVESALRRLPGCAIAVTADDAEGEATGEGLARDLGGVPFRLPDERRALYHAAAVFASNHLVTATAVAEQLFAAAGVPDPAAVVAPLQRASLENVERLGAGRALTGPAVRGDAGTIRRNLDALKQEAPDLVAAYVAMARVGLDVADRAGRLPPGARAAVESVLTEWT